jgi:hypothetical protein
VRGRRRDRHRPLQASAASRISACFSYRGYAYRNLSTAAYSLRVSGTYKMIPNSFYRTDSSGCVSYTMSGSDINDSRVKIRASGSAPGWRGYLDGFSASYAPAGRGRYSLGRANLGFYRLPPAAPNPPVANGNQGGLTSSWMDALNGSVDCNQSPAMQVACYMDRNHLHGNVVTVPRDFDGDGVEDWQDNYVGDPSRH